MYPEADSDASREGTAAHWVAECLLSGKPEHPIGTMAPNGVVVTDEILLGAKVYADNVRQTLAKYRDEPQVLVLEQPVKCGSIHPEYCWGTPDARLWLPRKQRLILWDFKFGHGEVEVVDNDQLLVYLSGILDSIGVDGLSDQELMVEFRIVQPRCYTADGPIRTHAFRAHEARTHFNQLAAAAEQALRPNPPTVSGPHCAYCPARHACSTARRAAMSAVDYTGTSMPEPVTAEALSFELELLERAEEAIKARKTGIAAQVESFLRAGKQVPGYALEQASGRRKWRAEHNVTTLKALGAMYGINLIKEEPITPTQAKQKGVDASVIEAYSEVPSAGMRLVKQDLSRITRILTGATSHG